MLWLPICSYVLYSCICIILCACSLPRQFCTETRELLTSTWVPTLNTLNITLGQVTHHFFWLAVKIFPDWQWRSGESKPTWLPQPGSAWHGTLSCKQCWQITLFWYLNILNAEQKPHLLLLNEKLFLPVWPVSSKVTRCRAFWKELQNSSYNLGEMLLTPHTIQPGVSGIAGMLGETIIPLQHSILQFLAKQFDTELQYCTVNTYISNIHKTHWHWQVGCGPPLIGFMVNERYI